MKKKVYQVTYMYELENQEYVDENVPDLGIRIKKSLTERQELSIGKTPAQAISNWEKKVYKREPKAKVYIIEIKEYLLETPSGN